MENSWNGADAARYFNYCEQHDTYRVTSAHLVTCAARHLSQPRRVVDLACGTGVTALEILKRFGPGLELTCADQSEDMLAFARASPRLAAAAFLHCPAEEIERHAESGIDLITCNSAFWLMNMQATLRAAAQILGERGLFVFNIPGYMLRDAATGEPMGSTPVLMEEFGLAARGEGLHENSALYALSENAIARMAAKSSYTLLDRQHIDNDEKLSTTFDALRIPALLERYARGVAPDQRLPLLQQTAQKIADRPPTSVTWFCYVLRRCCA